MLLLSRYILKQVFWTTLIIAFVLTVIIWLTQTLRLLDFIINGGAPVQIFGTMLLLVMPKFLEVILPISLALGIIYSLNKFSSDSELVVMQNVGANPIRLALGTFLYAVFMSVVVFFLAAWGTPQANHKLDQLRDVVKSDYSFGLMRPGVFNVIGANATIYIAERNSLQDLKGVFIHYKKPKELATTITAQHGGLVTQDGKPYVIVFDGMRQQYNPRTTTVETLRFDHYSVNLSELSNTVDQQKMNDPSDKTLDALLVDLPSANEKELHDAHAELHRRLSKPLLTLAFALLAIVPFLTGSYNRRGQSLRITSIIAAILVLQCLYLMATSMVGKYSYGFLLIYGLPLTAIFFQLVVLFSENGRNRMLSPVKWLLGGKERMI